MTLSHWLAGRRRPSARRMEHIYFLCETVAADSEKETLVDMLWQAYYEERPVPAALLLVTCEKLLRSSGLKTRTLALLSWLFEREPPPKISPPAFAIWRNRLGWLYESAGLKPGFEPAPAEGGNLLEISTSAGDSRTIKSYLSAQQTLLGKKWNLYDCSLDDLKVKLEWRKTA